MYISKLVAEDFRSLHKISVDFSPGVNALIGRNNSGKSNIMKALDILLGEKHPKYNDFNNKDYYTTSVNGILKTAEAFSIAVCLKGGNSTLSMPEFAKHRKNIFGYSYATLGSGGLRLEPGRLKDYSEGIADGSTTGTKYTPAQLIEYIRYDNEVWFWIDSKRSDEGSENYFSAIIFTGSTWLLFPDISRVFREELISTAHIPSFRFPSHELRVSEYSWFGKLIKYIYQERTEAQQNEIKTLHGNLAEVVQAIFSDTTKELRQFLADIVFDNDVSFRALPDTSDDEYKSITPFIDDGINTPFYEKGSGIQSALVIALFSCYCSLFHKGGSVLLTEEPEIFLHPQSKRALESQLGQFVSVEGTNTQHQVILSTHAPEFLRSIEINAITLVRKSSDRSETKVQRISVTTPTDQLGKWKQILASKNAEMLFARHVILVEGGEEYFLPRLADIHFSQKGSLDRKDVTIARVDGKTRFREYVNLLQEFGIGYTILTDLDFARDEIEKFSEILTDGNKTTLGKVRSVHSASERRVKEAVSSENMDWIGFYNTVDTFINNMSENNIKESQTLVPEIKKLWGQVKNRIVKYNIRDAIANDKDLGAELEQLLHELQPKGFYILQKGDIEDYFTSQTVALDGKKEMRAIALADKLAICENIEAAEAWIETSELCEMLDHVNKMCSNAMNE